MSEVNEKYTYVSVRYEDDDVPHRTYYYISEIEDLNEGQKVLVDRNGMEAIGIVEKIEIFQKDNVPFPIENTKHILKEVDEDYEPYEWYDDEEYEEEIESYHKLFLNTMFSRLSIKRLINLMFVEKRFNQELIDKLFYMPRMNLFFYKNNDNYRIAETPRNILSDEIFRILERESIEIPRKITDNIYTANNYKEAILFCRENDITIHDDTDVLEFSEQKEELNPYKNTEIKEESFKKIEDVIKYLKNYKRATYRFPIPDYYIENNKIIHYMGWVDYDRRIFELYSFLIEQGYIDEEKAHRDYEKHGKEWEDWSKWNIEELNYEKLNYFIIRLYNRERICEGLINDYAETGKLLKIVELLRKRIDEEVKQFIKK